MRGWLAAVVFAGSTMSISAASITTETFEVSTAGWGSRSTNLILTVAHTNSGGNPGGALSLLLPQAVFIPASDALAATGGPAASAFLGDYTAVGAELLSFDIRADSIVPEPNSVRVNVYSGTNYFTRIIDGLIPATGVWIGVRLPLQDAGLGGWTNVVGAFGQFDALKTNVTRLEVEIRQSTLSAQRFRIDNLALEAVPRGEAMQETSGVVTIRWTPLREGRAYRIETGTGDAGALAWTSGPAFTATAVAHSVVFTGAAPDSLYRLRY